MKNLMFSLFAACALVVAGCQLMAAEELTGKVRATQDAAGQITAVALIADGGKTYEVTVDEQGKALATLNGKMAKVSYEFADPDKKTIKVLLFSKAPDSEKASWEQPSTVKPSSDKPHPKGTTPEPAPKP